eukprot:1130780-Alexandrium_andersonii.AAC.1
MCIRDSLQSDLARPRSCAPNPTAGHGTSTESGGLSKASPLKTVPYPRGGARESGDGARLRPV